MKSWFVIIFLLVLPTFVSAEVVNEFTAEYTINKDGSVSVIETVVYDFGDLYRHGMYRTLTTDHAESDSSWYRDRQVKIELGSVLRDGINEPFTEEGLNEIKLKIGDPDTTITGAHVYTINYTLYGALSYLNDTDAELYWNVTGSKWEVPLDSVHVKVNGVSFGSSTCYVTSKDCVVGRSGDFEITANAFEILPGNELTIATLIPNSQVERLIYEPVKTFWPLLVLAFLSILVAVVTGVRYRRYYHRARPIVAEYQPYEGVEPMYAGTLLDDRLDNKDIAAGFVYLAEQGFISIKKTERTIVWFFHMNDYEVTLKKDVSEIPSKFLALILALIFTDNTVGTTVALSSIKNNNSRKMLNAKLISQLTKIIRKDLVSKGFIEEKKISKYVYMAAGFMIASTFLSWLFIIIVGQFTLFALLIVAFAYAISAIITYRRRTEKGYEAMYNLKGFKEFLSVTDKERFDFHNAPERSPEQFMKYLPYAIAFGVEEKWAEVFKDMEISSPDWYEGNGSAFVASSFVSDISSFTSAVTASTTPASSGGGSSGGGGGGGGGGSW